MGMDGMLRIHPEMWKKFRGECGSAALMRKNFDFSAPAVIISGGSADGPFLHGFVWDGLADAAIVGGPHSAPNAYLIYETAKYMAGEHGALLIYNNFMGDYLNNDLAQDLLRMDGIRTEQIILTDDTAMAVKYPHSERNGRIGMTMITKLASGLAQSGMSLEDCATKLRYANERLGSLSMHVDLDNKEVFYGVGTSGEPGIRTEKNIDIRKAVEIALEYVLDELKPEKNEKLYLLINRMENISHFDSCRMAGIAADYFEHLGYSFGISVGGYLFNQAVYGCDFSILCADAEMQKHMDKKIFADSFVI